MLSVGHDHMTTLAENPMIWQEFTTWLPIKQKWVFKHLKLLKNGQPIIQAVLSGHAVAVSDGSFKDGQGTTAWMIYDLCDLKTSLGGGHPYNTRHDKSTRLIPKQTSRDIWDSINNQCVNKILPTTARVNPYCLQLGSSPKKHVTMDK